MRSALRFLRAHPAGKVGLSDGAQSVGPSTVTALSESSDRPEIGDGKALHAKIRAKNATPVKLLFKRIASIFIPLIPAFIACGLISGTLNVVSKAEPAFTQTAIYPLLAIGGILSQMDFNIIWRYFSWTNQTLAMIVLWTGAVYLYRTKPGTKAYLIPMVPAVFMSAVTSTYILQAPEGLQLSTSISYPVGLIFAVVCLVLFLKTTVLRGTK